MHHSEERIITHLQATRWEDDGVITDPTHFEDLNKLLRSIKKRRQDKGKRPAPIVVHCSAGIGRTGTMIAIYCIIEAVEWLQNFNQMSNSSQYRDEENKQQVSLIEADFGGDLMKPRISVFGTVRRLREQRWSMVKKQVQYGFIYDYCQYYFGKNLPVTETMT